jgi:hypothetical protein
MVVNRLLNKFHFSKLAALVRCAKLLRNACKKMNFNKSWFYRGAVKRCEAVLTSITIRWFFAGQIRVAGLNIRVLCTESGYGWYQALRW